MANDPVPSPAPSPAPSSAPGCSAPVDYKLLREQKLKKITEYYNELLDLYTSSYITYSSQNSSLNGNDRIFATTTLKPQIEAYNNQIIKLSELFIESVNKDNDLILEQITELNKKNQSIDKIINDIKLLRDKNIDEDILEKSQLENLDATKTSTEDIQFTTQIYMGINILLILMVIGLIIYLVYSNYTTKSNNDNSNANSNSNSNGKTSTNNNINKIYKNIKVNN